MLESEQQNKVAEIADMGRQSLFFFSRAILAFDKMDIDIHGQLCQDLENYKKNIRKAIILPRDWYKSTIATICYPIWRAVNNPNIRILITQNTYTNACAKLSAIKQIFDNNALFRTCYPELLPKNKNTWSSDCLMVNRTINCPEGTFEAAGTGTAVTGRHYDLVIEDDTVSPDKDNMSGLMMQPTQAEIEKAIGWHRLATPLLIEPLESQILVIGTRWAENDLLGHIIENNKNDIGIQYSITMRAAREDANGYPDPNGKVVWPKRFPVEVLKSIEAELGPYMFASLYLNSPTDAINQLFKREWINYYQTLPEHLIYCTSVDPAASEKEDSSDPDYNVVLTTAINPKNGHVYVVHYSRERCDPGTVIDEIFRHYRAYKPVKVVIEGIAYQRTLSYWLEQKQKKLGVFFYVETLKSAKGSKVDRVRGLQPFFASNRIFLRADMPELERELLSFPKGAHDDLPDALSMHLDFWNTQQTLSEMDEEERIGSNQHAFRLVLNELQSRSRINYPNDLGNKKYTVNRLRSYVYN